MKTKLKSFVLIVATLALFVSTGCQNPRLATRATVFPIAVVGLQEYPEARIYVAAATPVICAAATTNAMPLDLTTTLEELPSSNPTGILLLNSALVLVFSAYPPEDPDYQQGLLGVCDAFNLALAATRPTVASPQSKVQSPKSPKAIAVGDWPRIRRR